MLEQYNGRFEVGHDVLERGLVLERLRLKAAAEKGIPPETDEDILRKAAEDADQG